MTPMGKPDAIRTQEACFAAHPPAMPGLTHRPSSIQFPLTNHIKYLTLQNVG